MKTLFFSASMIAMLSAAPLHAEDVAAAQRGFGESLDIIVTAQRRAQDSQDVGMALSVIAGGDLDEKAVSVINDIENVIPNLEVDSQFGSGQPQFRIRGIGAREYSSNNASTVGIYVNEVAHPYTITTQGALFDVARIEVLRGPQGTLYGRNTTGGAINIIPNAPTEELSAGVSTEYGSHDQFKIEGHVSGALAPNLRARLAAITEQGGVWQYHRITGEELGDADKTAVRGLIEWTPAENIDVNLSLTYMRDQSDGRGFRLRGPYRVADGSVTYPADTAWRITGWQLSPALAQLSGRSVGDKPGRDNEGWDLSARIGVDFGGVALNSITAYQTFDRSEYNDWDGTPAHESDVYFFNDIQVFSQELRLSSSNDGPLEWMVGGHYANESNDGGFYTQFRGLAGIIRTPYEQDVEAVGLFTHNRLHIAEGLRLIAGLRYEYEKRELSTPGTSVLPAPLPPYMDYDTDLSEVSGRIGLEYQRGDALFYANISRGVKSGGFTTYNATSATPFRPEIVIAYEAGFKSDLFDNLLRLNGALFYYDYKDQQVQGLEYDRDAGRLGKITNVPKSHIWGGELELVLAPVSGLLISQHFGYKKGQYDKYDAIDGAATDAANPPDGPWDVIITNDRSNEPLQFPKLTYGGSLSYDLPLGGHVLRAETNYYRRDAIYSATSASVLPGYWLVNANLGFGPEDGRWQIGAWARNLFDQRIEETRNGFNGSARPTMSPNRGRTIGVRFAVRY